MKLFHNMIINFHIAWESKWMERVFLLLKNIYNLVSLEDIEYYYYKNPFPYRLAEKINCILDNELKPEGRQRIIDLKLDSD